MKVLEKGSGQKGWAKQYACTGNGNGGGGCRAKLLIEEHDLFETGSHHYDGSSESYTTFRCCECGVETDIPNTDYRGVLVNRKTWASRNGFIIRDGKLVKKE